MNFYQPTDPSSLGALFQRIASFARSASLQTSADRGRCAHCGHAFSESAAAETETSRCPACGAEPLAAAG